MPSRQTLAGPLPRLWLVTDQRSDAGLDSAVLGLPRGAGVIFRHYHLPPVARVARFGQIRRLCRRRGLVLVWAGDAASARRLGADGCYGAPAAISHGPAGLRLATVHGLAELADARRARSDLVLLSPVFPTRTHPGAPTLGPLRWLLLARRSPVPVIAMGGMTATRARRLPGCGWAAIDGLAHNTARIPKDS